LVDQATAGVQNPQHRHRLNGSLGPILLKNSVREFARAKLRKPTSQIDPGSTIATSARWS